MSNLIECDGCGGQISLGSSFVCGGCGCYYCYECSTDMPLTISGLCDKCWEWAEEIVADCEQRKQEFIVAKIKAAMDKLQILPDFHYVYVQDAWLELNELLEAIA